MPISPGAPQCQPEPRSHDADGASFCTRSAVVVLSLAELGATPLDKEGCTKLKAEQGSWSRPACASNMAKGPEWAKANLAADKLEQIRRLIEVDEQLLFRCTGKPLVELPAERTPIRAASGANEDGKDAPNQSRAAPPRPRQKESAAKKARCEEGCRRRQGQACAKAAKPAPRRWRTRPESRRWPRMREPRPAREGGHRQAQAQTQAKAKADDAYKPPRADPTSNPFTAQTSPAK